jgi:hypothetical protein
MQEISDNIKEKNVPWAEAHIATINQVSELKPVAEVLTAFINKSIDLSIPIRNAHEKIAHTLKTSAMASFRLGVLCGLLINESPDDSAAHVDPGRSVLLDDPPDEEPCGACLQTGETCLHCGVSRYDCICQVGDFSPVQCESCGGMGVVKR